MVDIFVMARRRHVKCVNDKNNHHNDKINNIDNINNNKCINNNNKCINRCTNNINNNNNIEYQHNVLICCVEGLKCQCIMYVKAVVEYTFKPPSSSFSLLYRYKHSMVMFPSKGDLIFSSKITKK